MTFSPVCKFDASIICYVLTLKPVSIKIVISPTVSDGEVGVLILKTGCSVLEFLFVGIFPPIQFISCEIVYFWYPYKS